MDVEVRDGDGHYSGGKKEWRGGEVKNENGCCILPRFIYRGAAEEGESIGIRTAIAGWAKPARQRPLVPLSGTRRQFIFAPPDLDSAVRHSPRPGGGPLFLTPIPGTYIRW